MSAYHEALRAVCADLERHEPTAPSLHFAKGVLAVGVAQPLSPSGAPQCDLPEDEIVARFKLGESAPALGREYGVSSETIYRITRVHGIKPGSRRPRGPKAKHAEKFADIVATYEAGKSVLQCAVEFDVAEMTVRNALKAFNIQLRGGGRKAPDRIPLIMKLRAEGKTLEEIGAVLDVTRERVRQLVAKAGLTEQFARPRTAEQLAILAEYPNGATVDFVAERLGIGAHLAKKWLTQAGYEIRPSRRQSKRQPNTIANAERAAQMYSNGITTREIAEELGLNNPAQIYRLLSMAGVKPSRLKMA